MTLTVRDEHALVTAHRAGDPDAFAEIVTSHWPSLLGHARRRLHDGEAARDALQETFLRAYRSIDRFGGELYLGAWLHRILENVCNDETDRRRREQFTLERVGAWRTDHVELPAPPDTAVMSAVRSLPETYREALLLRAVGDLSFRDLAAHTGVSEDNARARFHRARALLRRILDSPAALLLPVTGFVANGVRRARQGLKGGSANATGAVTQVGSTPASSVLSSPATHVLAEVAAAPDRTVVVAKVLLTVATAVPFVAAAVPSPSSRPPAANAPVAVAAGPAPSTDDGTNGPASPHDVSGPSAADVMDALGTVDAVVALPAPVSTLQVVVGITTPITRGTTEPVDAAVDESAAADSATTSSTVLDGGAVAPQNPPPPPAPRLYSGRIATVVAAPASGDDEWRFEADVPLEIEGQRVAGHLVGKVRVGEDGSVRLWCSFTSDDGSLVMAADGVAPSSTTTVGSARSFAGTYDVAAGSAEGFAPAGAFRASFRYADGSPSVGVGLSFRPPAN